MNAFKTLLWGAVSLALVVSCAEAPQEEAEPETPVATRHLEWVRNANIYEVNIRQYTPEGTFKAFSAHLPRLKEMGVDVLWLMPVQPIGKLNRKVVGKDSLGSYYSISDYSAVHPGYGTEAEFKAMVDQAHGLGMKVILDWVANHTAFDHHWTQEHPEFYTRDEKGNISVARDMDNTPTDWTDVADLNYEAPGLAEAMFGEMRWWIDQFDIDGFRCDVAGFVPNAFWDELRPKLEAVKPLFMLAEWEDPAHMKSFDMNYGWDLHHRLNQLAQGKVGAKTLDAYFEEQKQKYQKDDIRMYFITNHDENSWNGTEFERMGDHVKSCFALCVGLPGMPLMYSGQEVGLNRRLSFFGKDSIEWGNPALLPFYKGMLQLKHEVPVLWNGNWGGDLERIPTADSTVYAFRRFNAPNHPESELWMWVNLGAAPATATMPESLASRMGAEGVAVVEWKESGATAFDAAQPIILNPNSFRMVYSRKP